MASKKSSAPQSAERNSNQGAADLDAVNAAAAEAGGRDMGDFQPSDFDHAQAAAAPAQVPPEFEVTAVSMLSGALFTMRPSPDRAENAPQMTGTIQLDDAALRVPVAAFVKSARETGVLYCALTVGFKDGPRYYGRLFSASHKNHRNAPDYHGFIWLLPVTRKGQYTPQEWDDAPMLPIHGYRRRNASDNRARIQLLGAPVKVADHELPI